jgi:hypothetical protein
MCREVLRGREWLFCSLSQSCCSIRLLNIAQARPQLFYDCMGYPVFFFNWVGFNK